MIAFHHQWFLGAGLHDGWNGGSQAIHYNLSGAPGFEHFPDMKLPSSNSAIKSLCFFFPRNSIKPGWHRLLSATDLSLHHTSSINKK